MATTRDNETRSKHAAYMREYYATHPAAREQKRAADRERYQRNREKVLAYQKIYYEQNKEAKRAYSREWSQKRRDERRVEAFIALGDKCMDCGTSNRIVFQFHHRDPSAKKFDVGGIGLTKSSKLFFEELAKCDLVCANCHLVRHHEMGN